jgi:hypothetical protein
MSHSYAQEEYSEARNKQKSAALCRGTPQTLENDLSIAEVRKALSCLRKGWEEVQLDRTSKPLYLSNVLTLSQTQRIRMEEFALRFVLAHHQKRHSGSGASENNGR